MQSSAAVLDVVQGAVLEVAGAPRSRTNTSLHPSALSAWVHGDQLEAFTWVPSLATFRDPACERERGRRSHHWVISNASTTIYVPVEAGFCWPVTWIVSV